MSEYSRSKTNPETAAALWAKERHTRVAAFAVARIVAGRRHIRAEFASFAEARAAAERWGESVLGRRAIIVALSPEGWAFELERIDFA